MSEKGKRFVFRDGKFQEGKATPWLPPEHLRGLPSEFVTKDTSDGDKIHELDPPHIVKELVAKHEAALSKSSDSLPNTVRRLSEAVAPVGARVPLSQERIDIVRFKTIRSRITRLAASPEPEKDLAEMNVDYVFFPDNNVNKVEIRKKPGNPGRYRPLPQPLPKHLRGFKLEIDIYNWPESVLDALAALGHKPPNIKEMLDDAKRRSDIAQELQREERLVWTPDGNH